MSEAKKSLGGEVLVPLGEVGNDFCYSISPCLRKTFGYRFEWIDPHRDVSCSSLFMSSLCGVGVRARVRVNNFSSKTTRPRDVLFFLKDTLSIEDEKLFKACKSVCSSVC